MTSIWFSFLSILLTSSKYNYLNIYDNFLVKIIVSTILCGIGLFIIFLLYMTISDIAKNIQHSSSFPPVDKWNPDLCIGQTISIDRNGDWFYNNSIIKNSKIKKIVFDCPKK